MSDFKHSAEVRVRRRARRNLKKARLHLADPHSKLGRLLRAYEAQRAAGQQTMILTQQ